MRLTVMSSPAFTRSGLSVDALGCSSAYGLFRSLLIENAYLHPDLPPETGKE
jgi:hypothetical protein